MDKFLKKHKKAVFIAIAAVVALILFVIYRAHQKSAAATAAANANPYAGAVTTVTPQTAGNGGEYGSGYTDANNLGQLSDQLAGINSQISALQSTTTTPPTGGTTGGGSTKTTGPVTQVSNWNSMGGPNLNGLTISQAQSELAGFQGGKYSIVNNNDLGPNVKITSFTPYSSGAVRTG